MKKSFIIISSILLFAISGFAQPKFNDSKLAHEYYRNKEYAKAVIFFEELYSTTKSKSYLTFYLNCLWELNKFDEAEKVLKKEIRKNSDDASLYVELGTNYKKQGDLESAEEKFEQALKKLKPKSNDIYHLANAYTRIREFDYAEKTYLKGRELLNDNNLYRNQLANVYLYQRKHDLMINEYMYWILERPENIKHVQNRLQSLLMADVEDNMYSMVKGEIIKRIQASPDVQIYNELLTWLYIQKKEFNKAFVQSKAMDKRNDLKGAEVYKLANMVVKNKSYDLAKKMYSYVLDYGKESPVYYLAKKNYLNTSYLILKQDGKQSNTDLQELKTAYLQALDEFGHYPQSAPIMLDFAHLRGFYLGEIDEAITLLEILIAMPNIEPDLISESKLELAEIKLMTGDIWDAALIYGQVEKANQTNPIGHEAKFRKAKLYYYSGNFDWAQALLDILKASTSKLIANNSFELAELINDNTALDTSITAMQMFARADMLAFQQQETASLLTYDSIMTLFPDHSLIDESYMRKGDLYSKQQNFANAIACYQVIVDNYSSEVLGDNALFKLADLYENKIMDKETAMTLYQKLLTDYPSSIFGVESRKRFRNIKGDEPKEQMTIEEKFFHGIPN